MHAGDLRQHLAGLFEAHGFKSTVDAALEGRSRTIYQAPVLAERGDLVVLVERRGVAESVQAGTVTELARVVEDTGADVGLLVYLGEATQAARQAAGDRVLLWDRALVTILLGELALHHAAGTDLSPLPLDVQRPILESQPERLVSSLADILPPAFQETEHPGPSVEGPDAPDAQPFDLDGLESLGGAFDLLDAPHQETTSAPGAAPVPPAAPASRAHAPSAPAAPTSPASSHPALEVRVGRDEAARRVQGRLFHVDGADLVLQPVHLLDFECDLLLEGSLRYDTVRGRLQVHGIDKSVREVDPFTADPAKAVPLLDPGVPTEERPLRIQDERARQLAHEHLLATHTRVVAIESHDEDDEFSVIEQKRVAPRSDQVRLYSLGVVVRPQWRLRGPNGAVLVDAVDGEVLGEELRTPDPGTMMLD